MKIIITYFEPFKGAIELATVIKALKWTKTIFIK